MINTLIMKKTIPLDLIETLICIETAGSFALAAEKLGISQAGVSFKMKTLEKMTSLPLFSIQGKKKILTAFALEFAREGKKQSLNLNRALENVTRKYEDPKNTVLRIASRPEIYSALRNRFSFEGTLIQLSMSSAHAIKALDRREIDFALSHIVPDSTELIAKKLISSSSVFVCHQKLVKPFYPAHSKNLGRVFKSKEFLSNTPALFYQSNGHLLSAWIEAAKLPLDSIKAKFVSEDWRLLASSVMDQKGYAILPDYIEIQSDQILSYPIPNSIIPSLPFHLLYRKELAGMELFKNFIRSA